MSYSDKKAVILATDGFEQSELENPKVALEEKGIQVTIVSLKPGKIKGWTNNNWGNEVKVDKTLDEVDPNQFDCLILPGGVINPDKLRMSEKAICFIKHFVDHKKIIAAICHGPWTLINANAVSGRKITSWPSIKMDLLNAKAHWVDEEVVCDGNLITSRKPDDLEAFNNKIIEKLWE